MSYWKLFTEKPKKFNFLEGKAPPDKIHLFSKEAEEDAIRTDLKLTRRLIRDLQQSVHESLHAEVAERQMEKHEDRAGRIRLYYCMKRTGNPLPPIEELSGGGTGG